jgi:hypothetical protein
MGKYLAGWRDAVLQRHSPILPVGWFGAHRRIDRRGGESPAATRAPPSEVPSGRRERRNAIAAAVPAGRSGTDGRAPVSSR